ncbi:MAG: hypothetical protein RLZZ507_4474 [Cyanobacteriota bacterium]|jgi:hypothetical protein
MKKSSLKLSKIANLLILTAMLSLSSSLPIIKNNSNNAVFANSVNFHSNRIKNNKIEPVKIPEDQLPPPLDQNVIFREIASGGFAGLTYQTTLLSDGLLMRVRIGDANDSERSVRRVSLQEVKKFEKLLNKNNIAKFKNLSYPAPSGAADFITYTLTSQEGTFQYKDISQDELPKTLQSVVSAWRQLQDSAN